MPNTLRLLLAAAAFSTIASAQQPPATTSPLSTWPTANAFSGGRVVLVSTFNSPGPHLCQVRNVEAYRLVCGGRSVHAVYDREQVEAIAISPKSYAAVNILQKPLLDGGLAIGGIGLFCGVDGGNPCKTPTIVGLSMIATAGVLQIVKLHQRRHLPQVIYRAAPVPAVPDRVSQQP